MRSRMVAWIDLWERSVAVEGARTSMSRWRSSHQKGVESMESVCCVGDCLNCVGLCRCHVFQKSGGGDRCFVG